MSMYIINDDWIREYERNIEELIGSDLEYDSATNPTPPLRKVDGTRWHELFGTPERAASTLKNGTPLCGWCDKQTCEENGGECSLFYYDVLLEWLGGDAE